MATTTGRITTNLGHSCLSAFLTGLAALVPLPSQSRRVQNLMRRRPAPPAWTRTGRPAARPRPKGLKYCAATGARALLRRHEKARPMRAIYPPAANTTAASFLPGHEWDGPPIPDRGRGAVLFHGHLSGPSVHREVRVWAWVARRAESDRRGSRGGSGSHRELEGNGVLSNLQRLGCSSWNRNALLVATQNQRNSNLVLVEAN
jgi:hypothetical protein